MTDWHIPYRQGYRAGHLDQLVGLRSEYAWWSTLDHDPYSVHYGKGYRDGWNRNDNEALKEIRLQQQQGGTL